MRAGFGGRMKRYTNFAPPLATLAVALSLCGCTVGPSVSASFDRSFTVTGPLRIDITGGSGDVHIKGSADGKVHIHGDVRSSGSSSKQLDEFSAHPPLEQREDTIRIGRELSHMHHLSVSYTVEAPHGTQINSTVVSGAQDISGIAG